MTTKDLFDYTDKLQIGSEPGDKQYAYAGELIAAEGFIQPFQRDEFLALLERAIADGMWLQCAYTPEDIEFLQDVYSPEVSRHLGMYKPVKPEEWVELQWPFNS